MTYLEWLAATKRLADEIAKIEPECKRLQDAGDWANVSVAQTKFYAARDELAGLMALKPAEAGGEVGEREPTLEEWRSEGDWISHEIGSAEIEWNVFRKAGDWSGAQGPQQKYHELRARQTEHEKRKPKTSAG